MYKYQCPEIKLRQLGIPNKIVDDSDFNEDKIKS